MATKNKRLEIQEFDKPLVVNAVYLPKAPPEGAIIKIHYAGICHSDVHMVFGDNAPEELLESLRSPLKLPVIPGHEISGEVFELGANVDKDRCGYNVGDHVMVYPWVGCRECVYCKRGDNILCLSLFLCSYGEGWEGGFQEYLAVQDLSVLGHVPDVIPMDLAAVIPCSGITAYSAIMRAKLAVEQIANSMDEVALLIVGAGGLGLWGIQIAKATMPSNTKVYVAEISESKFQSALEAGADQTILWDKKATMEENIAATRAAEPEGFHAVVDFVGSEITVQTTVGSVAQGAIIVSVGLYTGTYSVLSSQFPVQMLTITGSLVGRKEDMAHVIELVAQGKVSGPPMSHVNLEDVPEVLDALRAGSGRGRCVVRHI